MRTDWERASPPSPLATLRRDLPRPLWPPALSAVSTSRFPSVPLLPVLSPMPPGVFARARDAAHVLRNVVLALVFMSPVFCVLCVLLVLLSVLLASMLVSCARCLPRLWFLLFFCFFFV